jgi:NIMA (never in mitosis gene a)-related kinase
MTQKNEYQTKYKELEIIGRGNFGSATLVRSEHDNNIYVAKKVLLGGLSQKEQDGAKLEVNLLKELKHPHVVEYKESYIEDGVLIIIMEYCEEGDLTYFTKKKAQKNETLDEKLILNWFLQLLLALEFVHRKKILHRDIKSSNIFLRSNGTVKLGDFGISKILDNTHEAAMTVVGTPYYMSPEVCENKPYTFKSDVWALGCVLYEMCTLKHAFSASNLLGLVYKIVREQHEPIPNFYSKELSVLVQKLLTKNVQSRPSIRDIFMETLIQKTIEEFIKTDGQFTTMVKIPVKKTQLHKQNTLTENSLPGNSVSTTNQTPGGNTTMMSLVSVGNTSSKPRPDANSQYQNETPQQRMLRKKEEQRREQEELMKKAAKESLISRNQDKERKNKELQSNVGLGNNRNNESVRASNQFQTGGMNRNQSEYGSPTYPGGGYNQSNNNYPQYQQYGGGYEVNSPGLARQQDNNSMMTRTLESQSQSRVSNVSAFNPNERDMNSMQKSFLDNTNQTLSYSQSNGSIPNVSAAQYNNQFSNNPYNSAGAYGFGGNYAVKDNTGYSVYSIKTDYEMPTNTKIPQTNNYYQDDRPLPALNKNAPTNNASKMAGAHVDQYDDEYAEDFEEYWSDEEENDGNRLTLKATQKDMVDIINLYKEKLNLGNNKNFNDLEEIRETTAESLVSQPEQLSKSQAKITPQSSTRANQVSMLITKAKTALGPQQYEQAYNYLKKHRELGTPDKIVKEELGSIVGKNRLAQCFDIDQIIFLESM